jgi:hypothetical protein
MKAASKRSTSTAVKTSIPQSERKEVTQYRGFMIAAGEKDVSNEKAYQVLLKIRAKAEAERKQTAAAKAKEQQVDKREKREQAIKALSRGISQLADTRDLLRLMEKGDFQPFCAESQATFARATLADAGAKMEQALLDLGLIEREKCGYFVDDLSDNLEEEVTA